MNLKNGFNFGNQMMSKNPKKEHFRSRISRLKNVNRASDYEIFTNPLSEMSALDTSKAQYGSVYPPEKDQIITELSQDRSNKVPSVGYCKNGAMGEQSNLPIRSNNQRPFKFDFGPEIGFNAEDYPEVENDQTQKLAFDISGGGSLYNDANLFSINFDSQNMNLLTFTPKDVGQTSNLDQGINTLINHEQNECLSSGKLDIFRQPKKNKSHQMRFFPNIKMIIPEESKHFNTEKYTEEAIKENSLKFSEQSPKSNKKQQSRRGRLPRLNKTKINQETNKSKRLKTNPTSIQNHNQNSILKSGKSKNNATKSVWFQFNDSPRDNKLIFEQSHTESKVSMNLIPSIGSKMKLRGIKDHQNKTDFENISSNMLPKSVNDMENKMSDSFFENFPNQEQKMQESLNFKELLQKDKASFFGQLKSRKRSTGNSIIPEESSFCPKSESKQISLEQNKEGKNILKMVGKRILKRVKESIDGMSNLKMKMKTDPTTNKINFAITDSINQNLNFQFDFVLGDGPGELNINEFLSCSNESSPISGKAKKNVQYEEKAKAVIKKTEEPSCIDFKQDFSKQEYTSVKIQETNQDIEDMFSKYEQVEIPNCKEKISQFKLFMSKKLVSDDWGRFSKHILELLYGIDIDNQEFAEMGFGLQKMFKKLLVDRYFKDLKDKIQFSLQENPLFEGLVEPIDLKDNKDIWGISVEDYKDYFGQYANFFSKHSETNFPELEQFYKKMSEQVQSYYNESQCSSPKIYFNFDNKPRNVPSANSKGPACNELLKKRPYTGFKGNEPFILASDQSQRSKFSLRRMTPKPKVHGEKETSNKQDIFVDEDDEDFSNLLGTPSCKGLSSIKKLKRMNFDFQEEQRSNFSSLQDEKEYSQTEVQKRLMNKTSMNLVSLLSEVCSDANLKANLLQTLKFFISNLTHDLILHLILINYNNKNRKIDREGDGMADQDFVELIEQVITHLVKDLCRQSESKVSSQKINSYKFLQKFEFNLDFKLIQEFLAKREGLNCLQRKRNNNKFKRPKRNDEKVKKVYKKIMNQFYENFKKKFFRMKEKVNATTSFCFQIDSKKKSNLRTNYSYVFKPKEMELCFYAHYFGHLCHPPLKFCEERISFEKWSKSEDDFQRWEFTELTDKDFSERVKMLIQIDHSINTCPKKYPENPNSQFEYNKSITKNFGEFPQCGGKKVVAKRKSKYTSNEGKRLLKINSFFDPTKNNFDKKLFKSFTQEYFNHLLESDKFRTEVVQYLEGKFIIDFMKDYSAQIAKKLEKNRFHMLDLQKKKSKFLWNRYELLVALEYFKEKYCKDIFDEPSFQYQSPNYRNHQISSGSNQVPNENVKLPLANHQSELVKYFENQNDPSFVG